MSYSRSDPKKGRGRTSRGDAALLELIEISRAVGADPDLVQGGGGNTSVKSLDGARMFVKASGTALAEMDEARGWAELDLAGCLAILGEERLRRLPAARREADVLRLLEATVLRPAGARPSVESCLHALLDRVVIHTHPVGLNVMLSSKDSREIWKRHLRGPAMAPLYVPYVDPGYTLAARLKDEIDAYGEARGARPSVVLLENHGVFVAASDVRGCMALSAKVTSAGQRWIGRSRVNPRSFPFVVRLPASAKGAGDHEGAVSVEIRGALLAGRASPAVVRRDPTPQAEELARSPAAVSAARRGAFTPDQIVYCRTRPVVLSAGSPGTKGRRAREKWTASVAAYRKRWGLDPRVVIVSGEGVYYAAPDLGQLKVVAEVYRSAIAAILGTGKGGGPRFLSGPQSRFIESWEVEQFRAQLLAGRDSPLRGRIAVVSGAGSGLGKGLSLGIIRAGATVVGLDIDGAGLEEVARTRSGGSFLPLRCDVTDESSVRSAFATLVASAGGLDYLVNAAGIAPSYPLEKFPLEEWKKTLDINLTGYFLCAREAARLLKKQGAGGSIINLTSKSGLEASKSNSAYNATKAGEIHLMRGWAMELGEDGIRVNCVAPGNVFKGSKIWNEEYIRVCARKRGIRPEEVIPYYVSLSALGREIEPEDIASAVVFLLSDEARNITGQTIVVDGGQVMVR